MKKRTKKLCRGLAAALIICFTCSCQSGRAEEPQREGASSPLYKEGMELISDMHNLANDAVYIMAASGGFKKHTDVIAECNYDRPQGVYRIANIYDITGMALYELESEGGALSDTAVGILRQSSGARFSNLLIARKGGAENLAVSSVLTVSSCFVNSSITEPEVYIYTYTDAYPVIVSFVPGKNGAVSAAASCLFADCFRGADADALKSAVISMLYPYPVLLELEDITE